MKRARHPIPLHMCADEQLPFPGILHQQATNHHQHLQLQLLLEIQLSWLSFTFHIWFFRVLCLCQGNLICISSYISVVCCLSAVVCCLLGVVRCALCVVCRLLAALSSVSAVPYSASILRTQYAGTCAVVRYPQPRQKNKSWGQHKQEQQPHPQSEILFARQTTNWTSGLMWANGHGKCVNKFPAGTFWHPWFCTEQKVKKAKF